MSPFNVATRRVRRYATGLKITMVHDHLAFTSELNARAHNFELAVCSFNWMVLSNGELYGSTPCDTFSRAGVCTFCFLCLRIFFLSAVPSTLFHSPSLRHQRMEMYMNKPPHRPTRVVRRGRYKPP